MSYYVDRIDHPQDVELERNAGAKGIYVLTGHGAKYLAELGEDEAVDAGISEAAAWIRGSLRPVERRNCP